MSHRQAETEISMKEVTSNAGKGTTAQGYEVIGEESGEDS